MDFGSEIGEVAGIDLDMIDALPGLFLNLNQDALNATLCALEKRVEVRGRVAAVLRKLVWHRPAFI
jgi:hypothetical protein